MSMPSKFTVAHGRYKILWNMMYFQHQKTFSFYMWTIPLVNIIITKYIEANRVCKGSILIQNIELVVIRQILKKKNQRPN